MKNNYKLKTLFSSALMCIMMVFGGSLSAQTVAAYSFSQSAGTFTPIVGGTVLGTTTNDDNNFNANAIGFTFNYKGVAFTQVSVNANGFVVMGATAVSSYTALSTGTSNNVVAALNRDLQAQTGGELRIETIGVTPNRTCVIQWTNYRKYLATGDSYNFQIRLNETSDIVEVVYGAMTNNATTATPQVGLRGATNADFNNRTTTTNWSATTAGGTNAVTCTLTAAIKPASGQTFTWTPPVVCAGTPTAGITAGPTGACTGVNFTLSLTGASSATGLTYQWQSSPDNITYTNIGGATSSTASVSQTVATYYQCIVTCTASGMSATSTPINMPMNTIFNCYCVPTYATGCGFGDEITNVTLLTLNNTSACTGTPFYTFYSAATVPNLPQGSSPSMSVSFGTDPNQYVGVWIDFNQDGDFIDAGEFVANTTVTSGASGTSTFALPIPAGATLGVTMMRVRGGNDAILANTPCGASSSGYGETEDYKVNIVAPPPCPSPTALTATGITMTTANLGWTCTTCTGTFALEYGPTGFTPGTGTIVNPATSPVAVSGLTAGTTYQFYVIQDCSGTGSGFSTPTGPFSFTTKKAGDDVCDALTLVVGTNGPYNNTGYTTQVGEPVPPATGCSVQNGWCNATLENTIWFTFVAPASGRVKIQSPGFDTQLALYSAANCGSVLTGGATLIAANDDDAAYVANGGVNFSSMIDPINCLTPGTTYYILLDGYSGTVGSTTIVITDLGMADPSFTGLTASQCDNGTAVTLTPTVAGGVFAGTGVAGTSFDPIAATAGTYSVTYTLNGCYTSTQSVTVNAAPVASSSVTSAIACNGGTGTVTVAATGGLPAYTGTGAFTVPAGAYTYTVTDANTCSSTTTGTVTEPTVVAVTSSTTAILCNGGTSAVTIAATGGTGAYTGTGGFTQSAGTTVYTVTDANSCVGTASVVVTEPTAVAVTPTSTAVMCNGGTSTVTIAAAGGTGAYTGTGTFTQSAGTTVYTVTDANSCTGTASVVITEPTVVVASSSVTSAILCNGGTGTVTVSATGGTPSYTGTGAMPQVAGSATYTVTDANGCTATTSATITEPTAIVVSSSETGVLCNGGTSSVTISATGGTPGYLGQGTFVQSAGTTTYTITDANACTSSLAVTVVEPAVMAATSTSSAILCNGGTSAVTIVATGGTTPYSGDGSFTQSAGTTVYTVTDANLCTTTTSVTVTEPTAVMVMFSSTPILCNGGSSSVTITGMDGTPAYTGEGTFPQFAGTTTYTITDANGCTGAANVAVTEPAAIATAQTVNFCGSGSVTVGTSTYTSAGTYTDVLAAANTCDSTVTTTVTITNVDATTSTSGGVITANSATGTFQWLDCNLAFAPIASATSSVYTVTADGSYAVQVTDNGCVDTSGCVNIVGTGIANNSENVLSVYPNPTIGIFNISISNANISELLITIVDIQGKEVFSSVDKNVNGTFNKQINLEEISKGLYYIKVNTGAEVNIQKLIVQ